MGSFLIVELEAENRAGEEFGECRLIQALQDSSQLPVNQITDRIVNAVHQFSANEQSDEPSLSPAA
jgi:serine phosphatase RsbU (regulator of sigma subunit)